MKRRGSSTAVVLVQQLLTSLWPVRNDILVGVEFSILGIFGGT